MEYGGVDLFTTPLAAITEPLPIVIPLSIVTFAPLYTSSSITTGKSSSGPFFLYKNIGVQMQHIM
jgi:hypothetical protein